MATESFDKNIIIKEPEAVEKLVEILSTSPGKLLINKELVSPEALARSEEVLKKFFSSRSRNS